ncbi:hypothetical protein [Dactylosporangium salmoneum]|uniref:Uncharacterized protein n=1 Tax=Dactylosporangium salmoneum TaxID=53361 RepID=A0ABN3FCW0_9ACTN
MITVDGVDYGTAAEIAAELACPDVDADLVYSWGRRSLIERIHRPGRGRGTTWYRLDQAAAAELRTRESRRGRRRSLDTGQAAA